MDTVKTTIFICLAILAPGAHSAGLLDGYYQVTSLTITKNDAPIRGANNSGLYISASEKRVTVAGAWRGYPVTRGAIVERTSGDTLTLRDAEDRNSYYKFKVRGNTITGRQALNYDDGTREIIEIKAVIRKLSREEADRVRAVIRF